MKTISAGLQTHINGTTTSLATIWRIVRKDTTEFFFTDHDKDILFGGDTYIASSGYTRTAIANDVSLAVDNLNVEGIFDSAEITEVDIRAGKFDFAEIFISIINWDSVADGVLKMRKGHFGEVTITKQGIFRTELRGLTQQLSQNIGELYQPECRADLGDSRCKVPIDPALRQDSFAYVLGDFIRVNTGIPITAVPITNAGFDTGDLTGWTTVTGNPAVVTNNGSHNPQAGTHFLHGTGGVDYEVRQDVDISGIVSTVSIDAGAVTSDATIFQSASAGSDTGAFTVEALDNTGTFISTLFDSGFAVRGGINVWVTTGVTMTNVILPVGTRKIRYRVRGTFVAGSIVNASFDSLTSTVNEVITQLAYENRIYECTVAGTSAASAPTFDTVVGNTTIDGTATFTARQAWMRHAVVDTVTDNKVFTITVAFDEVRAVDDYFNGGAIEFETGNNDDFILEVRDWVQSTRTLTVFLPAPFTVVAGDKIRLYPGCDKRSTTCITKFVIPSSKDFANGNIKNFRGEPFVPGQDELVRYPDAKSG